VASLPAATNKTFEFEIGTTP